MVVAGWFEVQNGVEQFTFEGRTMRDIAKQCIALDSDVGDTDMEAETDDGEDVTQALYAACDKLKA